MNVILEENERDKENQALFTSWLQQLTSLEIQIT